MVMTIENTTGGMLNKTFPGIVGTNIKSYDVLMTVIGILGVVSNCLLLIAMVRYRSTIFTCKGAYLIANMAIADLLTGLNSSRWGLRITFQLPQALDKALFSIWWTSVEVSFLTILVMSMERYIAIVFPFKAQVWLSKTRTIKSCMCRSVVHRSPVQRVHCPLPTNRPCLPHDFLRNHNTCDNVLLLQDYHQAERAEGDFDVHAIDQHPGYAQPRRPTQT